MTRPYQQPGLTIRRDAAVDPAIVKALQRDLRGLGYLRAGIDGVFGAGTEAAIRSLQYDLLNNFGESRSDDGEAPVAVADFNVIDGVRQVAAVTGILDQPLAACLDALLTSDRITQLPSSNDPAGDNQRAAASIAQVRNGVAPSPFMVAIFKQESGLRHFNVPGPDNADNFIVVGLDRAEGADSDHITSRGYGVGQFTLFHHPPRSDEVTDVMRDPVKNVAKAFGELRRKFDRFITGPDDHAVDRQAEHPLLPLRLCKYAASDSRYLADCRNCALQANKVNISPGTPVYPGAPTTYRVDQYYHTATYVGVPDRSDFPCDWPYAVRRYNGGGLDSYHYQTRVLLNLVNP